METLISFFDYSLFLRVFLAVFLGFAVGMEREMTNKYAGLRTNILVCVGACIFTILSIYGFSYSLNPDPSHLSYDTSRVGAQIVSGIGFIGGGTVLKHGVTVMGLTTAATLWVSASIGMACGAGMYGLAIMATVFSIIVLVSIRLFEKNVLVTSTKNLKRLKLELKCQKVSSNAIYDFIVEKYPKLKEISKKQNKQDDDLVKISVVIDTNVKKPIQSIYKTLQDVEGIDAISVQEFNE